MNVATAAAPLLMADEAVSSHQAGLGWLRHDDDPELHSGGSDFSE